MNGKAERVLVAVGEGPGVGVSVGVGVGVLVGVGGGRVEVGEGVREGRTVLTGARVATSGWEAGVSVGGNSIARVFVGVSVGISVGVSVGRGVGGTASATKVGGGSVGSAPNRSLTKLSGTRIR